jgi:hypothetical protein
MTEQVEAQDDPNEGELAAQRLAESSAAAPDYYRDLAAKMIRSGEVTPETTFADAKELLAKHHEVRQ